MLEWLEKFLLICSVERGLAEKTIDSYKKDLSDFISFSKQNITTESIRNYLTNLHHKQFKRSSYLRKLSAINQFTQFLVEEEYIPDNPMVDIKRPKKEKRLPKFLNEDEVGLLINAARTDDKFGIRMAFIIELLYASGMRISELLSLKTKDIMPLINSNARTIMIKGKGNKERIVPIRKKSLEMLTEYLKIRDSFSTHKNTDYLFSSRSKEGHLTREQVGIMLKSVSIKANIDPKKVSPHVLRHSFAKKLCNKKVNLRVVQELLGHSDISTTEIYIDTMTSEIIDFVKQHHPMNKQ